MTDTGFFVPKEKLNRFAEMYDYDKDGKLHPVGTTEGLNHDFSAKPALPSGGGGLVSTATDYMRFCQMLLNGGHLDGVRLLSPRTVELMRSNVLSPSMPIFAPGAGFGLDFAVYTEPVGRRRRNVVLDRSGERFNRGRHDSTGGGYRRGGRQRRARCAGPLPHLYLSGHSGLIV
jgi:CubicO group peptidase (beta-lactamase class C family)